MKNKLWLIVLIVSLAAVVVSGINVFRLSREYQKGINEYQQLESYASVKEETPVQEESTEAEETEEESLIPVSVDIQYDELKKINEDFSVDLPIGTPGAKRKRKSEVKKKEKASTKEERMQFVQKKIDKWTKDAADVLLRYLRWIEFWKKFYKPESVEEEWHLLFAEALQNESKVSYLVDMLMFGTDEEILDFFGMEGRR